MIRVEISVSWEGFVGGVLGGAGGRKGIGKII